ncbi:PREDICTED: SAGA-associated factor 11 homolog isoform X2 [Nicrophorus vespilloides]|uniref:SAGA-associated factor 11 homolog n=1 Tax=Nicrophorus vespilloides TaxID=110193 RepID=A0ABM1MG78_NICVS|nr:PREDICTED: SAGA-associated factor 11 homolog isoform X2 [Nicrophorus vespilloides]
MKVWRTAAAVEYFGRSEAAAVCMQVSAVEIEQEVRLCTSSTVQRRGGKRGRFEMMAADEPQQAFTHDDDFHDIVNDKDTLRRATERFLVNMIDELTLGIIFDTHRKYKTRAFDLDGDGSPCNDIGNDTSVDIFGQHNMKKTQECECPNCDRAVVAARFAPHLEACLGMGRSRSRNASRRIANNNSNNNNKDRDSNMYSELPSDDEFDDSGDKRRKKKHRNGNKKGKGTPKKLISETEPIETTTVDIEGDEDGDVSLKDFLQDNSNHSSPVDVSAPATPNSNKSKKDKNKNKKNKRDRTSPSTSLE